MCHHGDGHFILPGGLDGGSVGGIPTIQDCLFFIAVILLLLSIGGGDAMIGTDHPEAIVGG